MSLGRGRALLRFLDVIPVITTSPAQTLRSSAGVAAWICVQFGFHLCSLKLLISFSYSSWEGAEASRQKRKLGI